MKKHILIPLAVIFLSIIGCSKPDNGKDNTQPPTPPQEQITIPSTVDVTPVAPPEGGDAKISFTAAAAWTASVISTKADSWVDVNPKSGDPGPAEIKITTTPNDTYVERNATIRINCGGQAKDVVLTQKQVDNITVTTDKVELGAEGGTFTIKLKSNIDFSYEIKGDWIKYVSTKAYTDKTLTFSAEPNDDLQKREGSVTVKGGEFSETVKVYQSGGEPTLIISKNEYSLEADGGSIAVEVSSNVAVTMTIPEDAAWITENKTKSVSTSTFHLDVAANETYETRSTEIMFSNEESGLSEKITVNQNGKTFVHVTSVTLDKNELTLIEDEKATLIATVSPEDATDKSVEWSSDKPEVASVDENGEVTAKSAGTATITVTTKDGGKTATCTVTIDSKFRPVTSVTLDKTTASLKAGETVTLTATVNPDDATDKTVSWTTSDATVATVDNGVVTAKKVGTATITAKAGDKTATCAVTVITTPVTSVTLNQTTASLKAGETVTLTATVNPDDATDKTVTWSTSDATIATVNNGVVTAKKVGTATITAKAGDKTATCAITVVATPVTSVTLNQTSASLKAGETVTLTATVSPDDATDKTVTWSTSDATIATVDNGVVTAKKVGTTTITAKVGDKTATCTITVVPTPVTSVTLNQTSAQLKAGETVTLTATVKPDDATDKTVIWTTTDATVATVNNGTVTAKKVGTATITAKAGDKTATCAITVITTPVTSVTLNQTSAQLKAGETVTLTATVNPDDATDKTVTWSTTDATVATVDNGKVTAKKVGTATITAKAGDKTATCAITVVATPVTSVTLNQTSASLKTGETVTLTATVNPDDATDKTVTWTTTDATVATVNNGVVTAKKVGTATITAKAGDKTATCAITVVAISVTSVTLNQTSAQLKAGETVTLTATVNPDDATDKTVTWSTSDATIATVNNGVVTAKKVGTATITAKAGDKTATCAITVVATPVTSISLNQTSAQLKAGETVTLTATVNPDDATDKTVTWSTSDATVATVNNGVVTAIKVGTATITAKAGDKTATCTITVVATPVTSVTLDKTSASLKAGETVTLTATVNPDDATDKTVTWSTTDATVATVNNGVVTAKKVGTATITAKAGDKTATCTITVIPTPVTSISLDKTSASLKTGETITLAATVKPDDATNKTVTWTTTDATIATVSNGVVTAKKVGTATITAKAGDKTATCAVTVITTPVTSVTLNQTLASLKAGETVTLTATVSPDDATDKTVTWTTTDATVATVNNGVVTAKKVGTATITAKAGDKTATCAITVVATPVTSVTLNQTSASLKAGETVTLTATVNPDDATDKTVTWSTSDATIATVNNGVVTAKKVGTATITAKAGDKTATCAITVIPTPVTSIRLDIPSAYLKAGETVTLTATVSPDDATDKTVTWSTSDATIATVSNGVVTAKKVGTATITAKAGDKTATCAITVITTPVTSVTLNKTSAQLKAGETVTLTATVNPSDATDKTVYWSSNNPIVATVNNGVVTAQEVGTATITASAGGKTTTCVITVVPTPVASISLDKTSASLKIGETITLAATVKPDDATNKTVTWTTTDATIATVSNGVVTAKKVGTATITAKAGDRTATCVITVIPTPVTSISLDKTSASLKIGETITLAATVKPDDATNKTVTWTTTDATIATVSNGVVTAKKVGTATITAKAGDKTATCTITVEPILVTSVSLDKTSLKMIEGDSQTLIATVSPNDATNRNVIWTSSNSSIVSVDKNGEVTAIKAGTASITVTTEDGGKTATCNIKVDTKPNVENPEEGDDWGWN